jgi:hypothetical protein
MNDAHDYSPLLELATEVARRAPMVSTYQEAASETAALRDALESFRQLLERVQAARVAASALKEGGISYAPPDGADGVARTLRALADRVEQDPKAIGERRREIRQLEAYADALTHAVNDAHDTLLEEARAGTQDGIVRVLRRSGLTDAAGEIQQALAVLGRFDERPPGTAQDVQEIRTAAAKIRATLDSLQGPGAGNLVEFIQRTLAGPPVTLADIDADVLERLRASGAAENFNVTLLPDG